MPRVTVTVDALGGQDGNAPVLLGEQAQDEQAQDQQVPDEHAQDQEVQDEQVQDERAQDEQVQDEQAQDVQLGHRHSSVRFLERPAGAVEDGERLERVEPVTSYLEVERC